MAKRNKANLKSLYGSSGSVFPDNTTRQISEADLRAFGEDLADSLEFVDGGMTAGDYPNGKNITNAADTQEKQYNFLWYAGSSATGTQDLTGTTLMPEDSVLTCEIHGQGVAADGSAGISVVKILSMRRDGAATPVVLGSETSLHNVEDSGDTPTIVLSVNSGDLRVSYNSGSATVYHWTIFAKISITKV